MEEIFSYDPKKPAMLSTIDNPFNPFTDYDEWYAYDVQHNHDCCGIVAHLAKTSDAYLDEENSYEIQKAIDWFVKNNLEGIYCKVFAHTQVQPVSLTQYYEEYNALKV